MSRPHTLTSRHICFFLSLLLLGGFLGFNPATAVATNGESTENVAAGTFPGLQDVVPNASKLADDLLQMTSTISAQIDIEKLTQQTEKIDMDWQEFSEKVQSYDDLGTWPINRLLQAQTQVEQNNLDFDKVLTRVSEPLSIYEDVRVIWSSQKKYWNEWEKVLRSGGANVPRETFRRVDRLIAKTLTETEKTVAQLVQLQQKISKARSSLLILKEQLHAELTKLRRDPLKRTAHSFFSLDFYRQFGAEQGEVLRAKAVEGIKATVQFQGDFFRRQGWLVGIQILLAFFLFGIFRLLEKPAAERAEQWDFVFRRPIAAALFISAVIPYAFYLAPPPLLKLGMTAVLNFSAARLAAALLQHKSERVYVYFLAFANLFAGVLFVTGMPLPYQRIYLTLFSMTGFPLLFMSARKYFTDDDRRGSVGLVMMAGSLILLTVVIAEFTGYMTLASYIFDASFGTMLLILSVVMLRHIGEGLIDILFTMKKISSLQFVKQLGKNSQLRFKRLLRIILIVSSLNYLLTIWGLGDNFEAVWDSLLGLEFSIGEFHFSLKMVLLVALTLYLTLLISWFFQAFLEAQIFYQKRVDRGVRDAVKKLSHYALILIGFLVALSMAGIDLKNFTILAGAFGIGIGFGLQDIVNNFISGLILLFERPVKVGDTVIIGDTWGNIRRIGMRSTVVETWDQAEIIVPNSQMISEKVTNWTLSNNVSRVVIPVGVKYGTDMKKVLAILEKVALKHPEVVETPPASAIFTEFGDSSLNFELRVWLGDITARFRVRSEIGVAIDEQFRKAGIEIPFPQRDLHLRSVEPGVLPGADGRQTVTKKTAPRKKKEADD